MADVHIAITKKKEVDAIVVMPDQLPVLDDDFIFWHVSSDHPDVESVEIVFDKNDARFFEFKDKSEETQKAPMFRKALAPSNEPVQSDEQRSPRSILVTGRAPMFGELCRPNKYTVRALDKNGDEVVKEDPVILTTKPRG
jgi:hypothetical protein